MDGKIKKVVIKIINLKGTINNVSYHFLMLLVKFYPFLRTLHLLFGRIILYNFIMLYIICNLFHIIERLYLSHSLFPSERDTI